ncbi:MAG: hypothetical protein JNM94_04870 [Phycisphaerae bacterium]|nr:hypothetical protein [Phycisphaerae bacterium]
MNLCTRLGTIAAVAALSMAHKAPSQVTPPTPGQEAPVETGAAAATNRILVEIPIVETVDQVALIGRLKRMARESADVTTTIDPTAGGKLGAVALRGPVESVERAAGQVREFFQSYKPRPASVPAVVLVGDRERYPTDEVLALLKQLTSNPTSVQVHLLPASPGDQLRVSLFGPPDDVEAMKVKLQDALAKSDEWKKARQAEIDEETVTLQFPGGTVEGYVTAVLEKFGVASPIYADDAIRTLHVGPIELRRVDLEAALRVLTRAAPTDNDGTPIPLQLSFDDDRGSWARSNLALASMNERIARSVIVIKRSDSDVGAASGVRRAAFVLGRSPIERARLDPALDAVALAVNWNGASPTFRAKFHAPSNVLILQGTPDELALAAQIVKGTFPDAHVDMTAAPAPTASPTPIEQPAAQTPPTQKQPATSR